MVRLFSMPVLAFLEPIRMHHPWPRNSLGKDHCLDMALAHHPSCLLLILYHAHPHAPCLIGAIYPPEAPGRLGFLVCAIAFFLLNPCVSTPPSRPHTSAFRPAYPCPCPAWACLAFLWAGSSYLKTGPTSAECPHVRAFTLRRRRPTSPTTG